VTTVLWHVDALLGSDREISSYTITLPSNCSLSNGRCYVMAATDMHSTIEYLWEAVFSVRSVLRIHNEEQLRLWESLETAMRRVGCWCEMVASLGVCGVGSSWVVSSAVGSQLGSYSEIGNSKQVREAVNTEAEETTALKAVTRQRMKTQQAEKN
jgi:hypothetical protein